MAKTDWKAKAKALKKKLKSVRADIGDTVANVAEAVRKATKPVSPLAPAAFPNLQPIAGVEFAAVEAGVRYQNRKDVMLIRLAPGTTLAGALHRQGLLQHGTIRG